MNFQHGSNPPMSLLQAASHFTSPYSQGSSEGMDGHASARE